MNKKHIITTSLGNVLEWLDFGLFIFLAPIIGEKIFSIENQTSATLIALSVFAAGFICRPLGGILFGHAGDTHGRARTLRISVMVITISTFLVGVLPTYQTAGMLSPILFILLRLMHGIAIGGEYSGVMIYLAESAPLKKRGLITSLAAIGANLGFLLASFLLMLLTTYLSPQTISNGGWRLPFIIIGCLGSLILYYRFNLSETPAFSYLESTQALTTKPLMTALKYAPSTLIKIFGLTCMSATFYYVFFGYMPIYLEQNVGMNSKTALGIQSFFLFLMLFLVPVAGFLGDRLGRKNMLFIAAMGVILFSLPCFYLFKSHAFIPIILSFSIATVFSSLDQGNSLAAVVENCPANIRYSSIAFSYNLGMALFGGTAPLIITLLTEKVSIIAPSYYLILMTMITLIAITKLFDKSNILDFLQENNSLHRRSTELAWPT